MPRLRQPHDATPVPSKALTRADVDLLLAGGEFDPRWALTLEGYALAAWQQERAARIAALLAREEE
jgi:hypothetical protein